MNSESRIRPATRDAIVAAALALLGENPSASFSEIAIKAGVGRATLHRHFRNRETLIDAISHQCMDEMEKAVLTREGGATMGAAERLESMFRATVPLGDRYSFLQHQIEMHEDVRQRYVAQLDWLKRLVAALKGEGVVATDVPDYWLVSQIDQLIWIAWRAVRGGKLTEDDAVALAMRTILYGLGDRQ